MFFQKLPKKVQEGIKYLTIDKEFQDRFGHDEILDELDHEKFNIKQTFHDLLAFLGRPIIFKEKKIKQLTPLVWTYLWCADNPLVRKGKDITQLDVDMFFYALENGVDENITQIAEKSIGYCEQNGIDDPSIVPLLVRNAFLPLKMFPQTQTAEQLAGQEPIFDTDWLSSMITKVHDVTGKDIDYIMRDMSLSACCFYYIQYCRMNGAKNVERRPDEEILRLQDERSCTMILDRLIELKIVDESQRDEYFRIMTTNPESNK